MTMQKNTVSYALAISNVFISESYTVTNINMTILFAREKCHNTGMTHLEEKKNRITTNEYT